MRRRNERGDLFMAASVGIVVLVVVFAVGGIALVVASYQHETTRVCTVTDKDRASKSDGGSDMRVYTSDCGNLSVSDALFKGNFHSSDTYSVIHPGRTYEFTTIGFRIPFISQFPNIIEAREVSR